MANTERKKLDLEVHSSNSYNLFLKLLRTFLRPSANKINNTTRTKLLAWLRLGFSHLRQHRHKDSFENTLKPFCSCRIEVEPTSPFFQCCHFFNDLRGILTNNLRNFVNDFSSLSNDNLANVLLDSQIILMPSIRYDKGPQRCDEILVHLCWYNALYLYF